MTASFNGHADIVRILIMANAQIDNQREVWNYTSCTSYAKCTTNS